MAYLSPASKKALTALRAFRPPPTTYPSAPLVRRAAVLILLYADPLGALRVVLTIRSATLRAYASQAALPGGKADTLAETPFATARREALEEIGLPLSDAGLPEGYKVEELTELPANLAMTELAVRPCVAFLSGPVPSQQNPRPDVARDVMVTLDAREVAAVFTAPFEGFLAEKDLKSEVAAAAGGRVEGEWYRGSWHAWHETAWRMHQFFVPVRMGTVFHAKAATPPPGASEAGRGKGEDAPSSTTHAERAPSPASASAPSLHEAKRLRVHGMTARILVDCARVAYGREPAFEHNSHFGDEEMIGRLLRIGRLGEKRTPGEVLTREVMVRAKREGGVGGGGKL